MSAAWLVAAISQENDGDCKELANYAIRNSACGAIALCLLCLVTLFHPIESIGASRNCCKPSFESGFRVDSTVFSQVWTEQITVVNPTEDIQEFNGIVDFALGIDSIVVRGLYGDCPSWGKGCLLGAIIQERIIRIGNNLRHRWPRAEIQRWTMPTILKIKPEGWNKGVLVPLKKPWGEGYFDSRNPNPGSLALAELVSHNLNLSDHAPPVKGHQHQNAAIKHY